MCFSSQTTRWASACVGAISLGEGHKGLAAFSVSAGLFWAGHERACGCVRHLAGGWAYTGVAAIRSWEAHTRTAFAFSWLQRREPGAFQVRAMLRVLTAILRANAGVETITCRIGREGVQFCVKAIHGGHAIRVQEEAFFHPSSEHMQVLQPSDAVKDI